MFDKLQQYCATDKEVYDLLMSGKQRLTESVLHELAHDRGIFYSTKTTRDSIVDRLSLLTHDYYDIVGIIQRREHSRRSEKTTAVTLDVELTIEEIKEAVQAYQSEARSNEKVTSHQRGSNGFVMNLEYDEIDYSRTRLIQRQRRDAGIEFDSKNGKTTVRMPATEKAKSVVANLKGKIEGIKKTEIPAEEIELTGLTKAEDRTSFFTSIISGISGYSLVTVTNLKVASGIREQYSDSVDLEEDEEDESAKQEMLAIVHSVAINGENLVASQEYQQLRQRGFFITSITWRSKQIQDPYTMIQFDVGFENAHEGKGFRYAIRCAQRLKNGEYAKNFRPVDDNDKAILFELIENTARNVLSDLYVKYETGHAMKEDKEIA